MAMVAPEDEPMSSTKKVLYNGDLCINPLLLINPSLPLLAYAITPLLAPCICKQPSSCVCKEFVDLIPCDNNVCWVVISAADSNILPPTASTPTEVVMQVLRVQMLRMCNGCFLLPNIYRFLAHYKNRVPLLGNTIFSTHLLDMPD